MRGGEGLLRGGVGDGGAAALGNGHRLQVQGEMMDLGGKPAVTRGEGRGVLDV